MKITDLESVLKHKSVVFTHWLILCPWIILCLPLVRALEKPVFVFRTSLQLKMLWTIVYFQSPELPDTNIYIIKTFFYFPVLKYMTFVDFRCGCGVAERKSNFLSEEGRSWHLCIHRCRFILTRCKFIIIRCKFILTRCKFIIIKCKFIIIKCKFILTGYKFII